MARKFIFCKWIYDQKQKRKVKKESRWISLLKFKYCFANVLIISFQIFLLFLQQFGSKSVSLNIRIVKAFFPLTFINIQTEFRKYWDIFQILLKWKLKDFQITWANILFTIEHREYNSFKLRNFTLLFTKWAPFKFDAFYRSHKSWHGATKGWKSKTFWKDSAGRTSSN